MGIDNKEDLHFLEEFIENVLFRKPTELDQVRNENLKEAVAKFSESGWIPPYLPKINLSRQDIVRLSKYSPQEIDSYIYSLLKSHRAYGCKILLKRLKQTHFENPSYFTSALLLYRKREYLGCCMMLLALIEHEIRTKTDHKGRKISEKTTQFLDNAFRKEKTVFGGYDEHPTKYIMGESLRKVISDYTKNANDFKYEPEDKINRNFLMHGMAKRKYEQKDCIKLFLILEFVTRYEGGVIENGQSAT